MRVIAGEFRSRTLQAPRGMNTRPTSDRLRETLFNILAPHIEGTSVLDLYAGSGAVAIEALSRGAARAMLVEEARPALAAIRANLDALRIGARATVDSRSVGKALAALLKKPQPFDIVFLDPPYEAADDYEDTLRFLATHGDALLAPGALVVAEHSRKRPLPERVGALMRTRVLEQGDAALSFFRIEPAAEAPTA